MNSRWSTRAANAGIAAALVAAVVVWMSRPAEPVPLPADFANLDPYLKDYLARRSDEVRRHPRSKPARVAFALTLAVNGLWPEARGQFQRLASEDTSDPLPRMYAAVAAQESDDPGTCLAELRELVRGFPDFPQGWSRYGDVALRVGELVEARRAYEELIRRAPDEWRGSAGLGDVLLRERRAAEAIPLLERARDLAPGVKSIHALLGAAYRATGREADAVLESAMGRDATVHPMPDAWFDEAERHVKALPDLLRRVEDLAADGEPGRAVALLEGVLPFHPGNLSLKNQLAMTRNRSGDPAGAERILRELLMRDPNHVAGIVTLSYSLAQMGRFHDALGAAERAVALSTNIPQGHIARANALLGLERDVDAVAALETARLLDPQNAEILLELGDVLWKNLERPAEAVSRYETARAIHPALGGVYVRLASILPGLGRPSEARQALATLRRVAPGAPEIGPLERALQNAP